MRSAALLIAFAAALAMTGTAHADRPITTYEWLPAEYFETVQPTGHRSNIIFLNRCEGGCPISGGGNDSRTNRSFIGRPGTISEWGKGDEQWEQLVDCVKAMYDPYDMVITDVDPGPNVEHFEAIVAGRAGDIGISQGVGGIAPFSCGVINNAITFSFANEPFYANGIDGICETVAQETAHSFGLEHAYLCSDPMTYLSPCGYKWFQDENASCGEYNPANCQCRNNQNSHRIIGDHFGAGENPGPKLTFVRPLPSTNVEGDFVIQVSGDDYYYGVQNVEVLVNGEIVGTSNAPPYIFNAPPGLSGITSLEVRGTDLRGYQGSVTAEVNVGSACKPGDCTDGRVCFKSFCIAGANETGGFGASCDTDENCGSSICAKDAEGVGSCTEHCELDQGQCPQDHGCTEAGLSNVCWPGVKEDTGGCGCNSGNSGTGFAGLFIIFLLMSLQRRRSREA
jgi:MYXO-CTERM domain-containing protein